ncbi:MAG: DNA-3-methyladenine glycosylase I, partial [Legionella sp.]|nr:DNA-3-methyladenine glycosylase I [Legionella sp.]
MNKAVSNKTLSNKTRCAWPTKDDLYLAYHDEEWGVPLYDDQKLFEFLILEGMQAGLSWITILKKREAFRSAFADFNPEKIIQFSDADVQDLL